MATFSGSSDDDIPIINEEIPKKRNFRRIRRRVKKEENAEDDVRRIKDSRNDENIMKNLPDAVNRPIPPQRKADNEFSEDSNKNDQAIIIQDQVLFEIDDQNYDTQRKEEKGAVVTPESAILLNQRQTNIDTTISEFWKTPVVGTYFIERINKINAISQRAYYLKTEKQVLFCAKEHGFFTPDIYINPGDSVHIKANQYTHKMITNFKKSSYSLYQRDNLTNDPVMTIDFDNNYGEYIGPRKIKLQYGEELTYTSRIPKRAANGMWKLSFGGHFTIPSCRNTILLDSEYNKAIVARKVGSNVLELSVLKQTPLIAIAAFGIANYIYKE